MYIFPHSSVLMYNYSQNWTNMIPVHIDIVKRYMIEDYILHIDKMTDK
jgi:hypothetical protein